MALLKLISGEQWRVSRLTLQNITIDTSVVKMLLVLKTTLQSVVFTRCTFEKNVDFTDLGTFLVEIEIIECDGFTIKELKSLGSGAFVNLQRLCLQSLGPITGRVTKFILPSLRTLDLNRVKLPLLSILSDLSGGLHQLRLVQINGAIGQLETSTLIFPNLESLDIQGSAPNIKFLASVRSWFPVLKRLALSAPPKKSHIFDLDLEEDPLMILAFDTLSKSGIQLQFVSS